MGVLSEIRTMLSRQFIGSFASANGNFSALRAVRQGKRVFILYEPDKARTALPLFSLLPRIEALPDVLSFGRDPSGTGSSGVRVIAAVQSVQLLTRHYTEMEAKTLLSLFPNLITLRIMDPLSRSAFTDRYGTAHVIYRYMGEGNRPLTTDGEQKVVTDADFSLLMKPGQALTSLPAIPSEPFFYDGFRE